MLTAAVTTVLVLMACVRGVSTNTQWIHPRCANDSKEYLVSLEDNPMVRRARQDVEAYKIARSNDQSSFSARAFASLSSLDDDLPQWEGIETSRCANHSNSGSLARVGKWECELTRRVVSCL